MLGMLMLSPTVFTLEARRLLMREEEEEDGVEEDEEMGVVEVGKLDPDTVDGVGELAVDTTGLAGCCCCC
jgi:hypothetical protein